MAVALAAVTLVTAACGGNDAPPATAPAAAAMAASWDSASISDAAQSDANVESASDSATSNDLAMADSASGASDEVSADPDRPAAGTGNDDAPTVWKSQLFASHGG